MSKDITSLYTYCQGAFIPLQADSKKPIDTAWTSIELNGQTAATATALASVGYNIGYRIPLNHLIIDVDPRNKGDDSFKLLPPDVQALPITTITPSGGYHIYTRIPPSHHNVPLRSSLKDTHPGVDFLKKGKQVLLPGSSLPGDFYYRELSLPPPEGLPKRLYYTLHPDAITPPPHTPVSLLEMLKRPVTDSSTVPSGFLTNTDLASCLADLPVLDYNDNDSWLTIMMACHHATSGDGLEAFLAWSLQDPDYASQEQIIRTRWASATAEDTGAPMITVRSLVHELNKYGSAPAWLRVKAGLQQSTDSLFDPITSEDEAGKKSDIAASYMQIIDGEKNPYKLLPSIAVQISSDANLLESHREMLLRQLSKAAGTTLSSIRRDIAHLITTPVIKATPTLQAPKVGGIADFVQPLDDSQTDLMVATALIDRITHECGDVTPVYTNGAWYLWNKNHWMQSAADQDLKRLCISTTQNMGMKVNATRVLQICELARMQIECSYAHFIRLSDDIRIFTQNTVLFYDTTTHQWVTSEHHPDNRNLSTINVDYNPKARLPDHWLKFLSQATTSDHARRTLACAIIYAAGLAPPWLRRAFFLYGPSGTGKSATLDMIENLLGHENCTALSISQLGTKNGPAELVGKLANISNETLSKKSFSDDVFKALISGESVTVEKKYCDPFAFRNRAKFFLACNGFPHVSDESDAVWQRITLLSYPNAVTDQKMDPFLQEKFATERPGILKWAMDIFAEEYAKDRCRSVVVVDTAGSLQLNKWRRVNNPALEWLKDRTEQTFNPEHRLPLDQAYADYKIWVKQQGHRQSAKNQFSRVVGANIQTVKDTNGKTVYVGLELQPVPYFGEI